MERLSPREMKVTRLLAQGLANKEVAGRLNLSDNTVRVYCQHIMEKIGAGSAAELARLILQADPAGLD